MKDSIILYLRKDGRTFDMRFKENKEFFLGMRKSAFNRVMQYIANSLGSPKMFGSNIKWQIWLHPLYQIKRIGWRYGLTSPWKL